MKFGLNKSNLEVFLCSDLVLCAELQLELKFLLELKTCCELTYQLGEWSEIVLFDLQSTGLCLLPC